MGARDLPEDVRKAAVRMVADLEDYLGARREMAKLTWSEGLLRVRRSFADCLHAETANKGHVREARHGSVRYSTRGGSSCAEPRDGRMWHQGGGPGSELGRRHAEWLSGQDRWRVAAVL